MEASAITRSTRIHASSQRVWSAITEPQHLERWYAPGCPWEVSSLQAGATVKFHNTDTDVQVATIEVVEPLHELALRWQLDPAHPELTLLNTFLLRAENGRTAVTVTQAGYDSLPGDMRQELLAQDEEAYTAILASLKAYLESSSP